MEISFKAKLWMYQGKGAWYFVTLPKKESAMIRHLAASPRRGWGSVPVRAGIGETKWGTSIFPDSKAGAYLLPIKADIRKRESLETGNAVSVHLEIDFMPAGPSQGEKPVITSGRPAKCMKKALA